MGPLCLMFPRLFRVASNKESQSKNAMSRLGIKFLGR